MEQKIKEDKILDSHSAMSFVIKALYFPKATSQTHRKLQKIMNYDDVMFTPIPIKPINKPQSGEKTTKSDLIVEESDDELLQRI